MKKSNLFLALLGSALLLWGCASNLVTPHSSDSKELIRLKDAIQIHPSHWLGYIRLSLYYQKEQEWEKALEVLKVAQSRQVNSVQITRAMGYIYRTLGQGALALQSYEQALQKAPDSAILYMELGKLNWEMQQVEAAEKNLQQSLALDSELFESYFLLGALYASQEKYRKALSFLTEASEIEQGNPDLWYQISTIWDSLGNRFEAIRSIEKAIALAPQQRGYLQYYILLLEKQEQLEAVSLALEAFIRLFPEDPWGHAHYGNFALQQEQYDLAEKYLLLAVEKKPDYAWALFRLGALYSQKKLWRQAVDYFEQGLKHEPNNLTARKHLGLAYTLGGDLDAAMDNYLQALEAPSVEASIFQRMAQLYWENLQFNKVENTILQGLKRFPNHPDLLLQLAQFYEYQQRFEDAQRLYETLNEFFPEDSQILGQLGILSIQQNDLEQAKRYFEEAVISGPENIWPLTQLITLQLELEEFESAEKNLRFLAQQTSQSDWAYAQLGLLHLKQKNYEDALVWVQQGLVEAPQSAWLYEILAAIYEQQKKWDDAIQALEQPSLQKPHDVILLLRKAVILNRAEQTSKARNHFFQALMESDLGITTFLQYLLLSEQPTVEAWFGKDLDALKEPLALLLDLQDLPEDQINALPTSKENQQLLKALQALSGGETDEAFSQIKEFSADQLQTPWQLFTVGYLKEAEQQYEDAIECYQKALSFLPRNSWVYARLGVVAEKQKDLQTSIEYLTQFVEQFPLATWALFRLAILYGEQGNVSQSVAAYQRVLEIHSEHSASLNNLAWLYVTKYPKDRKKLSKALELAQRAITLEPSSEHLDTLAEVYFQAGETRLAIATLKRAILQTQPESETGQYLMKQYDRFTQEQRDVPPSEFNGEMEE